MALGDLRSNNNNGKSGKLYENTYYSRLGFKNSDGLRLGFSFRSGMIIAEIAKEKEGFQYEALVSCFITPTKARILYDQICLFESQVNDKSYKDGAAFGINSGMGEVSSVLLVHMFDKVPAITIGKINGDGSYVQKVTFKFNTNYHYGINLKDFESMGTCTKEYYDGTELDQLKGLLLDFANSMNGATAYSVLDLGRYDFRGLSNKLNPIYDKLGIERQMPNNGGNSENNFFSGSNGGLNRGGGRSVTTSIDSVMDDLPSED